MTVTRHWRILRFCLAAILAFLVYTPASLFACSCIPQTLAQQHERATYVLVGTVTNIDKPLFSPRLPARVEFKVERQWKGPPSAMVVIQVGTESAACGVPFFEEGRGFLLFLTGEEILETNLCAGNKPIEQAGEDLLSLDALAMPPQ